MRVTLNKHLKDLGLHNNVLQFDFRSDYLDVALLLPKDKQDMFLAAIIKYVMCDEEPDFGDDWGMKAAFQGIRFRLDKSRR